MTSKISELVEQRQAIEVENAKQIRMYESKLSEAMHELAYQNVLADTDGVIFDLKVREEGVLGGETILSVIPTNGLTARCWFLIKTSVLSR